MRRMKFSIEDNGKYFEIGQELEVSESKLPTSYYYTLENSYGMSGNYSNNERLKSTRGIVVEKKDKTAVLEFDE